MILGTQQKLVSLFLDAYKILSRFYKLTRNIYYQNSRNWKAVGHVLSAQRRKSSPGAAVPGRPAQRAYRSKPAQQAYASSASGPAATATGRPRRGTARTAQQREQAQGGRSAQAVCPQTSLAIYAKTTLLYSLINPRSKPLFI